MIEGDRGDRGGDESRWSHDVGGVEPSTESDLENGHIHPGTLKEQKGDRCRDFEERRLHFEPAVCAQIVDRRSHVIDRRSQNVAGNRTTVDDESLREVDQVRRCEARRPMARGAKRGIDHRGHRSLPVGAGNVDRSKRALGMAEPFDDRGDVLEAELDAELLEREQPG